jgi:hypothetical protein
MSLAVLAAVGVVLPLMYAHSVGRVWAYAHSAHRKSPYRVSVSKGSIEVS